MEDVGKNSPETARERERVMAKARQKKKHIYALLVFSLASLGLAASYVGYWFVSAQLLRQNITDWIVNKREEGWLTSTGGVSISGFPLDMNAHLHDFAILSPGGWGIVFPTLTTTVSPFWPYKLNMKLPRSYFVATPNTGWVSVAGQDGVISLSLGRRSRFEFVGLQTNNLTINTSRHSYRVQGVNFSGTYLGIALSRSNRPTFSFDTEVRGLVLPEISGDHGSAMGRMISSIGLSGRIIGNIPGGPIEGALALWRDNSGRIELLRADLDWSPLHLSGMGNLRLDHRMQPMGTVTGKVRNLSQAFDKMTGSELLSSSDVTMAKYALGFLDQHAPTQEDMNLALSIQGGQFYTGSAPLFKMPKMIWSDPIQVRRPFPAQPMGPDSTLPHPDSLPTGDPGPIILAPQQRH